MSSVVGSLVAHFDPAMLPGVLAGWVCGGEAALAVGAAGAGAVVHAALAHFEPPMLEVAVVGVHWGAMVEIMTVGAQCEVVRDILLL